MRDDKGETNLDDFFVGRPNPKPELQLKRNVWLVLRFVSEVPAIKGLRIKLETNTIIEAKRLLITLYCHLYTADAFHHGCTHCGQGYAQARLLSVEILAYFVGQLRWNIRDARRAGRESDVSYYLQVSVSTTDSATRIRMLQPGTHLAIG